MQSAYIVGAMFLTVVGAILLALSVQSADTVGAMFLTAVDAIPLALSVQSS